jgi:hypothetical protein
MPHATALVRRHDRGLDAAAVGDERRDDGGCRIGQARSLAIEPHEQVGAAGDAVFDHLVQAGAVLAARQRSQEQGIGDDEARRVEGADEILAGREIHADFASDGRVDLGQQRRRHLDQADAAQEGRGREARHVADDAAPDGHDHRPAIRPRADERVVDPSDRGDMLVPLAVRDQDEVGARQRRRHPLTVEAPHHRVRHDEAPRPDAPLVELLRRPVGEAVADQDGIIAAGALDIDTNLWHHRLAGGSLVDGRIA